MNVALSNTGVALSVTVSSMTKIFNVFISFIAYDNTLTNVYSGNYEYNTFLASSTLTNTPASTLVPNLIDFTGITGFIIGSSSSSTFLFNSTFSEGKFNFYTSTSFQYLNFNYFFITGSYCSNCAGYNIYYNGVCYNTCPQGTFLNGTNCIACPTGSSWNGQTCIPICTGGRLWSVINNCC
jgi:hypothetical protein